MSGILYYILDTETTGLKYNFHDIVEISVIRFDNKVQLSRKIKAENPKNASFDALRITGKTMKDLYQGVNIKEAVEDVDKYFLSDCLTPAHRCIVAHNAPFDRRFLHHTWAKYNKIFPADLWLDTLVVSKRIAKSRGLKKDGQSFKLHDSCDLFGIKKVAQAHNASDDAKNTFFLLKHFIDNDEDFLSSIKRIPHTDDE